MGQVTIHVCSSLDQLSGPLYNRLSLFPKSSHTSITVYASRQPFLHSNSHSVPYPFPIQTSTPGPIVVVTPVPVYVSPDSHFKSQMDTFSSSSNTGTNFNNDQFGNNFLNGKVQSTSSTRSPSRFDKKSSDRFSNNQILMILGFLLGSSFGSKYQHPLLSYPSFFNPTHLTPQLQYYASPQSYLHSNSHLVPYPFLIQTSTSRPIIVATQVPVFVTPESLFNSQRDTFSSGSSTGTNFNNEQFDNNFLNGKVRSSSSTRVPSRFTSN
ncbi:unnamed protein product [Lepeophtheirus salmonis]|uniref:(salmon louse) hypothetical protein n=1 Tax=Lepeophtheirus salmonis TaxID=72036 RepID=A0A7R8H446_LEPSM|nr:unnamed protein product [Lepeophtheirus salmonis]CAF2851530.1 unnamed protein product [Lepeophtheirus salmonis]